MLELYVILILRWGSMGWVVWVEPASCGNSCCFFKGTSRSGPVVWKSLELTFVWVSTCYPAETQHTVGEFMKLVCSCSSPDQEFLHCLIVQLLSCISVRISSCVSNVLHIEARIQYIPEYITYFVSDISFWPHISFMLCLFWFGQNWCDS